MSRGAAALYSAGLLQGSAFVLIPGLTYASPISRAVGADERGGPKGWRPSMAPFSVAVLLSAICIGRLGGWPTSSRESTTHLPAATDMSASSLFGSAMTGARFVSGATDGFIRRRDLYYPDSRGYGIAYHCQKGTQIIGLLIGNLMISEPIGSFGLDPLQHGASLARIRHLAALLALAWHNSLPPAPEICHG